MLKLFRQQLEQFVLLFLVHANPIVLHIDLEKTVLTLIEILAEMLWMTQLLYGINHPGLDPDETALFHVL